MPSLETARPPGVAVMRKRRIPPQRRAKFVTLRGSEVRPAVTDTAAAAVGTDRLTAGETATGAGALRTSTRTAGAENEAAAPTGTRDALVTTAVDLDPDPGPDLGPRTDPTTEVVEVVEGVTAAVGVVMGRGGGRTPGPGRRTAEMGTPTGGGGAARHRGLAARSGNAVTGPVHTAAPTNNAMTASAKTSARSGKKQPSPNSSKHPLSPAQTAGTAPPKGPGKAVWSTGTSREPSLA
mmetsp:Transcript_13663/g.39811  ORF Transcript_13663/g.39811 Transcript_13663/m.39811 type:complete len:237 (+) Transcript_13663:835-1545(+)